MPDFLIRSIDQGLLDRLRVRAERNGRSLQSEIHMILRQSVRLSKDESLALLTETRTLLGPSASDSTTEIRAHRDAGL